VRRCSCPPASAARAVRWPPPHRPR
jgi:hypothetical protein